jgi:hypothetical protein
MADHSVAGGGVLNAGNRTYETEYELAQDDEGASATGKNVAYGNAPRTSGGRFTPVMPKHEDRK